MNRSQITLHLARNPGTAFAGGDESRGYVFTAPLTGDGHLDPAAIAAGRCPVRRFAGEDEAEIGWLAHRGARWFIDYDAEASKDDEPIFRLGDHRFVVGEYLTITDADDVALTYRVAEVRPSQ